MIATSRKGLLWIFEWRKTKNYVSHSTHDRIRCVRVTSNYEVATVVDIFFFSHVLTSSEYIVLFTSMLSSASSVAVSECASVVRTYSLCCRCCCYSICGILCACVRVFAYYVLVLCVQFSVYRGIGIDSMYTTLPSHENAGDRIIERRLRMYLWILRRFMDFEIGKWSPESMGNTFFASADGSLWYLIERCVEWTIMNSKLTVCSNRSEWRVRKKFIDLKVEIHIWMWMLVWRVWLAVN